MDMTFKLSRQLDCVDNANLPFALYRSYIDHNRSRFPQSALSLIEHPDWSRASQPKAPYNSEVMGVALTNFGKPQAALRLLLLKKNYVEEPFHIEIVYKGLLQLDIPQQDMISINPLIWRYEQFLYYEEARAQRVEEKVFTHQVEWLSGEVWSITAQDIEVRWKDCSDVFVE